MSIAFTSLTHDRRCSILQILTHFNHQSLTQPTVLEYNMALRARLVNARPFRDTGLKNAEAELWQPSFVLFFQTTLYVEICKVVAGETTQSKEQGKNITPFPIWGTARKLFRRVNGNWISKPEDLEITDMIKFQRTVYGDQNRTTQLSSLFS